MKKMMFTLIAMLTIAASANAMSYEQARNEALFLTDKMAYELNLSDAQYEAAYEINLDYLMGVTSQYDVFGPYWERRNLDLSYILFSWQWDLFRAASYFYRPLVWDAGYWHFSVYARYPHRDYFYFGRPHFYVSYRGGHSWRMNGGRSYYEHHRDYYRPGNPRRDEHFGMRSGWDRGDYRGNGGGGHHSSTHVTGGRGNTPDGGLQPGRQGGFGSGRGGNVNGNGNMNGNGGPMRENGVVRGGTQGVRGNVDAGTVRQGVSTNSHGSFGGNRSDAAAGTVRRSEAGSSSVRQSTSTGAMRQGSSSETMRQSGTPSGGSRSSGSFGGGSRSGSSSSGGMRSGGSSSGGTRSSGGGGSRSGGSNSHGSFGGSRR